MAALKKKKKRGGDRDVEIMELDATRSRGETNEFITEELQRKRKM